MEQIMESHLEAFFLPFMGSDLFAIISSVWTLVAVFTTAVSFWGMKSVGSQSLPAGEDVSLLIHHQQQLQEDSQEPVEESKPAQPCHLSYDVRPCVGDIVEGTTKTKFTMYLEDYDCTIPEDNYVQQEEIRCCSEVVDTVCFWESCDQLMFVKRSMDLGWYSNLDLNALDGRVVKLWEDERR